MADPTTLRVGVLLPASRMFPGVDQDFLAGLRAAFAELGAEHVLAVEPVGNAAVQDSLIEKVQRLLLQHRPHIVTGIVGSAMLRHIGPLFRDARTPFIVNNLGAEPLLNGGVTNPWVFHNSFNLWQSTYALGYWASQTLGQRVCVAAAFHEAGYGLVPAFWKGFCEAGGGTILATEVTHRATADEDPSDSLGRLADLSPDFVFGLYSGREGISFAKAYEDLGLKGILPLVSTALMMHPRWRSQMGESAAGARTAFSWDGAQDGDAHRRFRRACEAVEWDSPDVFAILGYETGLALCHAVDVVPERPTGQTLRDAIAGASFSSPRGPWSLDPERGEVVTSDYLLEARVGDKKEDWPAAVGGLELPAVYRRDFLEFKSQELRPGWVNPYLVN